MTFSWVLVGFTGFQQVRTRFHSLVLGFTEFFCLFIEFYWMDTGLARLDRVGTGDRSSVYRFVTEFLFIIIILIFFLVSLCGMGVNRASENRNGT